MKKHNGLSFFMPKVTLLIGCVFLIGCSGGSDPDPSVIQDDQSTVANPITDDGELSSLVSTPDNDSDNNGIRDVVESSIKDLTDSVKQEQSMMLAAKNMQTVIDLNASGGDLESAVYEYEKSIKCVTILNLVRASETGEGINDRSLLHFITLASTNNTDNFFELTYPYTPNMRVSVEDCV